MGGGGRDTAESGLDKIWLDSYQVGFKYKDQYPIRPRYDSDTKGKKCQMQRGYGF